MKKTVKKTLISLVLSVVCAITPFFVGGCNNLASLKNLSEYNKTRLESSSQNLLGDGATINYDDASVTDILTVKQEQNISSSAWTKIGYNASLTAKATKIESNDLSKLALYLGEADEFGNLQVNEDGNLIDGKSVATYKVDKDYIPIYAGADVYSEIAPVYKDIDIVNVDLATGEIIGKLSNPNYPFEWYGRSVTLPAGTVLASGRTLSAEETFEMVDVYTYYPTMYIFRRVVDNYQYISLAGSGTDARNQQLIDNGFVKIDSYYTATFQATVFNADKTVAHNKYGIITRSYAYDRGVLTNGSSAYYATNWGYKNSYVDETTGNTINITSGVNNTNSTTQTNMQNWAYNLTKAWKDYKNGTALLSSGSLGSNASGPSQDDTRSLVSNASGPSQDDTSVVCHSETGNLDGQSRNLGYEQSNNQAVCHSETGNLDGQSRNLNLSAYNSSYTYATACQGENYTAFVYNLLYLVKYANNNSQNTVGKGNGWAYGQTNGKSVTNTNGTTISLNGYYDGEIGGSTIGVRNTSKTNTCGYFNYGTTENPDYKQGAYGYNTASMNYGYNSQFTYKYGCNDGADKQGLYNVQFLTHTKANNGVATKRYLLDGYVGSDQYTSVFCLGLSNVWANVWTWIYGTATSYDGTNLNMFVNYDNYTESIDGNVTTKNWIMDNNPNAFRNALTSADHIVSQSGTLKYNITNYNKININMPTSNYYRYMGTDDTTTGSKNSLIGLPVQNDDTHTSTTANDSTGLTDYFYSNKSSSALFGCLRGGGVYDFTANAGAFGLYVNDPIASTHVNFGFRSSLVIS